MIKSPGRKATARVTRGTFAPTLAPVGPTMPDDVATFLGSLNRHERRKFAATARAAVRQKRKREELAQAQGAHTVTE